MNKIPKPVIVYVLLVLYTASPLLCAMTAAAIANHYGCQLDEGNAHPCIIGGKDWGGTLYGMGVMGWFVLLTIPTGGLAIVVYSLVLVLSRKSKGPPS